MKKSKKLIFSVIASWFAFIAIDSTAGIFHRLGSRKMKEPFKTLYSIVAAIRTLLIFFLALLNFFLFLRMPKEQFESDRVRNSHE